MAQEKVNLFKVLFPNGYPADWEDNICVDQYLSKIGHLKVDELVKEPERLQDESSSILLQTQELAVSNYKTFIQTAECSHNLFKNFTSLDKKLDDLLLDIPEFDKTCQRFLESTSGINTSRRLNTLTLNKNAQLLEILELPQLMESFINEKLYEDALELAAYVRKLHTKHPDVPIFKSIVDDVECVWLKMLHQLLSQLKQDLQLPNSLQIISHLRRMGIFTEGELRMKFLQARNSWFIANLDAISKTDVNLYLTKVIEVTRINLFNIITQYRAIFNDDDHGPLEKNEDINYSYILLSWICGKIKMFLNILQENLSKASSLDSLLGQCMYFGLSFSRIGCDFRSLMVPVFVEAVSNNFQSNILRATNTFERSMERFTLINKMNPSLPWKSKSYDSMELPETLLEFYPLAEYLNLILSAFNELRLCAPISTIFIIVKALQESLCSASKAILVFYGQEHQAFNANGKEAFTRLCMCFADDLLPYIQKCINVIYPPVTLSTHIGLNASILEGDVNMALNKQQIMEPIKHLLPAKINPVLGIISEDVPEKKEEDTAK